MVSVQTLLSEQEFLALPESPGKQELLDGELIELPPARHSHDELAKRIALLLATVLGWSRVWIESGYRLGPNRWLTPDVSVSWPDQPIEDDWPQGAPMLAIEIASRGNTAAELERKRLQYLAGGAGEVWIVYPETHSMLVSRQDGTVTAVDPAADYRCELIPVVVTPPYRTPVV
ncbi:MAG TPA: Uma2 family endonuclease [Bryobacteraceae bacterium]|nr:Uma2 family endonuclease [Bryobacteraceae bacterium]